jgi:AcrR family transcriptional regulator
MSADPPFLSALSSGVIMENAVRSERSRNAILEAALVVIVRDGPHHLTLDAIARESGISKGGLMHQFRSKKAVLKALLERQAAYFGAIFEVYLNETDAQTPEATLSAQIATMRDAVVEQKSFAFAMLSVLAEEPELLAVFREIDAERIAKIRTEATDPELSILRWSAARGLMLSALFGLCPLSQNERAALFARLLDADRWTGYAKPPRPGRARNRKNS